MTAAQGSPNASDKSPGRERPGAPLCFWNRPSLGSEPGLPPHSHPSLQATSPFQPLPSQVRLTPLFLPQWGQPHPRLKCFLIFALVSKGPGNEAPGRREGGRPSCPGSQSVSQSVSQSSVSQSVSRQSVSQSVRSQRLFLQGLRSNLPLCRGAASISKASPANRKNQKRVRERAGSLSQCSKHTSHIGGWQKHTSCVINKGADQHRQV
ncbi:uncharacterized protein LOC112670181 [Canis lupus dingo]|uniref:uncharacterized protein LOC112670181 n=1 Tax=Canis lupus dingo TaxID=286419 RepID=UPI0020C46A56|nr:uncharacterized protein LOC112670181 [Canis lupus dingo]